MTTCTQITNALRAAAIPMDNVKLKVHAHTRRRFDFSTGRMRTDRLPQYTQAFPVDLATQQAMMERAGELTAHGLHVELGVYVCGCAGAVSVNNRPGRPRTHRHRIDRPAGHAETCPRGLRVRAVAAALARHPLGRPEQAAAWSRWFGPRRVRGWLDAGCGDPAVALLLDGAGVSPARAGRTVTVETADGPRTGTLAALACERVLPAARYREYV